MENLFRNTVKHAGTDVTVTAGELPNRFFVESDGDGIPEENREEEFSAGQSTLGRGTELGLSIVKLVVDAHVWKMAVLDGSDGGARFEITGVELTPE